MIWILLFTIFVICVSIIFILLAVGQRTNMSNTVLSVIGSGGHTFEMLSLINSVIEVNRTTSEIEEIVFVVSKTDQLSQSKIQNEYPEVEEKVDEQDIKYRMMTITRSREVHQSLFTSIFTTLLAFYDSLLVVWKIKPTILICNGPGVCIPIVVAAKILTPNTNVIFVESFCRTRSLSLSGRILYHLRLANHFLVQWPKLAQTYSRAQYIGLLV